MATKPPLPEKPTPPSRRSTGAFWWLVFLGLLVWNVMTFMSQSHPELKLPYTAFLTRRAI